MDSDLRGYDQIEAHRKARELGGIAVEGRYNPETDKWRTGGWANQEGARWIVSVPW